MTSTADRQHLLQQVGFPIAADGDAGPATTQATTWFQESWSLTPLAVDGALGPSTEAALRASLSHAGAVSLHFTLREFACPHCRWPRAHRTLIRGLEKLRAAHYATSGLPIISGYRCRQHNSDIHGAANSQHLQGRAADIPPHGDGGRLVTVEAVAALRIFGGLEFQPAHTGRGCTHVDTRAGGDPDSPNIFQWGS